MICARYFNVRHFLFSSFVRHCFFVRFGSCLFLRVFVLFRHFLSSFFICSSLSSFVRFFFFVMFVGIFVVHYVFCDFSCVSLFVVIFFFCHFLFSGFCFCVDLIDTTLTHVCHNGECAHTFLCDLEPKSHVSDRNGYYT